MDFNSSNKNNGKRKAQSIQDMINSPSVGRSGIGRSSYNGPKRSVDGGKTGTMDLSGISVNDSDNANRWGNSNEGMPKAKKPRVKSDVPNPMRGNLFKKEAEVKSSIARQGSQYSGPKSSSSANDFLRNATASMDKPQEKASYVAPSYAGPIDSYGWIIYCALLGLAVFVTLLASGLKPRNNSYVYPLNVFSMSGVINTAYEHSIGIPSKSNASNAQESDSTTAVQGEEGGIADSTAGTKTVEAAGEGDLNSLGDEVEAVSLDDGTNSIAGYTPATTHDELITQLESALAANDYEFVGSKIAYQDENSGNLAGYPLSLIKQFSEYMSTNSEKRGSFISTIGSEEYSAQNGSAYLIKLPVMKFTVKMGESTDTFVLDNTIVSVSGFSDQIVNGNQQAAIYPLLPCMYTVTLTNNAWPTPSQSQEIEATLGEGNLEIKVGI